MKIKLCGIRRHQDIAFVNEFRPDYVGFVFAKSKRQIDFQKAESLICELDSNIKTVGVFVNETIDTVADYANILDVIQLHGDENNSYISKLRQKTDKEIWRAVRASSVEEIKYCEMINSDMILIDSFCNNSYGGTGKTADWELIKNVNLSRPYFLAGGLYAENVLEAIKTLNPYGIDISSGIETDGFKDIEKIRNIMKILRGEL